MPPKKLNIYYPFFASNSSLSIWHLRIDQFVDVEGQISVSLKIPHLNSTLKPDCLLYISSFSSEACNHIINKKVHFTQFLFYFFIFYSSRARISIKNNMLLNIYNKLCYSAKQTTWMSIDLFKSSANSFDKKRNIL